MNIIRNPLPHRAHHAHDHAHAHAGMKTEPRVTAYLTDFDRRTLEEHLNRCVVDDDGNLLLAGLLRQKIARAKSVRGEAPPDLATAGRRVRYMTRAGARTGLLTPDDGEGITDAIPIRSLLGATLVGMRVPQRAPLLREDGTIETVVLLDVLDTA